MPKKQLRVRKSLSREQQTPTPDVWEELLAKRKALAEAATEDEILKELDL